MIYIIIFHVGGYYKALELRNIKLSFKKKEKFLCFQQSTPTQQQQNKRKRKKKKNGGLMFMRSSRKGSRRESKNFRSQIHVSTRTLMNFFFSFSPPPSFPSLFLSLFVFSQLFIFLSKLHLFLIGKVTSAFTVGNFIRSPFETFSQSG